MPRLSRNLIRRMILSEMSDLEDTAPLPPRKDRPERTERQIFYRKSRHGEPTEYTMNPEYDFGLPELDSNGDLAFNTDPNLINPDPIIDLDVDDSYADDVEWTEDMEDSIDLADEYTLPRANPDDPEKMFGDGWAGATSDWKAREEKRARGELPYQDLPPATIEDFAGAADMSPDDYRASLLRKVDQLKREIKESIRQGSSKKVLLRKLVELKACQNLHEQTFRRRRY